MPALRLWQQPDRVRLNWASYTVDRKAALGSRTCQSQLVDLQDPLGFLQVLELVLGTACRSCLMPCMDKQQNLWLLVSESEDAEALHLLLRVEALVRFWKRS